MNQVVLQRIREVSLICAFLALGAVSFGPAAATAGGGDCCSDLDERIAELEATTARKGNRRVSLRIFGTINKAIYHVDDGGDSDTFVVDNRLVPTRIGFIGRARVRKDLTAGYIITLQVSGAMTSDVSLVDGNNDNDDGGGTDGNIDIFHASWFFRHARWGRVSVGHQPSATFAIIQNDLSGTVVAGHASKVTVGASMRFRETGGTLSTRAFTTTTAPYFIPRRDLIRYSTPTLRGFRVSASWGEDDIWDAAIRYLGKIRDFRVLAGIGYGVSTDEGTDFDQVSGSVSVLHIPTGLNASIAAGDRDTSNSTLDQNYYYVKFGVKRKLNKLGPTAFSVDYYRHSEHTVADEHVAIWGVQAVQNIKAASMQLYANFSRTTLSNPTADYMDLDQIMAGARVRF